METKEKNLEEYSHPEGVEVKVSAARANITILLYLFFFCRRRSYIVQLYLGRWLKLWRQI